MITLENVSKTYDAGAHYAVREVSLRVEEGETLALVGSSGCGKTTTLKMINRLTEPTSGRIEIGGRDVLKADPVELRRGVGYVIQGVGLFPHWNVARNIGAVPRLLGWPRAKIDARVDELLHLVGMEPARYRDRAPRELSGGQRQRVGVARALAARPGVMLMDEPFGALDPVTRDTLHDELVVIRKKLNLTIVLVTHDMTEALLLADRIAVMHEGRVLRIGAPRELLRHAGDPFVESMLATPRRQAERLESLAHAPGGGGPDNGAPDAGDAR
ncbi:MAG: ATP-binding cassette domain-containing protein [Phycisphaerales bacterium]|nr:MAG: ATP-binding cassette domain-containing protein [Phycisphaerales bacterium]